MRSRCYAVPVVRLVELMTECGFHDVRRIDGRFFQPLIVGFEEWRGLTLRSTRTPAGGVSPAPRPPVTLIVRRH